MHAAPRKIYSTAQEMNSSTLDAIPPESKSKYIVAQRERAYARVNPNRVCDGKDLR
jgi:hypothetical protein